jgi:MFS family permease
MPNLSNESAKVLRRDWVLFAAVNFLFFFGFAMYDGVFVPFLNDSLHTTPMQLGILEGIRETPGLIAALMAGVLVLLPETRVAGIGLGICGLGIALTATQSKFWPIVIITTFWSIGFHLWSSVSPAITLHLAKGMHEGHHFGRMRSVGAIATIVALGISWIASRVLHLPYQTFFWIAGIGIAVGGVLLLQISHHATGAKREPLIFRKEYGLYYVLQFLEGCRRQVFGIFALFTLVMVYHVPVETILLLRFVNSILSAVAAPRMGAFIDRVGEKKPLTIYAIAIILIFLGYATIQNAFVLYALYIIDNVLFTFSIGFNLYLNRIVRPGELTPSLAMGVTMNHVAAVSLPILGAFVWQQTGNYQLPFYLGMGLAVMALIATRKLPEGKFQAA